MARRLTLDGASWRPEDLEPAVRWLTTPGHLVAFPTDTFYGLAADPFSEESVAALFALKGRDTRFAIPLIAASVDQVEAMAGHLDQRTSRLAAQFWPGPLSVIVKAPAEIAPAVHAGTGTVAIRVPAHPAARALAARFGRPLTATSANQSGAPPADAVSALGTIAADPRVFVVDGGVAPGGAPSTIVDARTTPVRVLREGAIAGIRVLESLHG